MSGEDPTWDYRWLDAAEPAELDALGARGWEVAVAVPGAAGPRLCLKRRGRSFRERVALDQKRRAYEAHGVAPPDSLEGER